MIVVANRRTAQLESGASAPLAAAPAGALGGIVPAGKDAPVTLPAPAQMIPKTRGVEGGAPVGSRKSYTNEEMNAMLQAETKREGIVAANPGEGDDDESQNQPFLGREQLGAVDTRAQAEEAIRQIAEMRHEVERGAGKKKDVPIAGNVAPVLSQAQ